MVLVGDSGRNGYLCAVKVYVVVDMADRTRQILGLLLTVVGVNVVGASPSLFVGSDTSWFEPPPWYPPEIVFPIAWTILFTLLGIVLWRLLRRRHRPGASLAIGLYVIQFVLNLAWTPVFFGLQRPDIAVVVIAVLLVAIVATMVAIRRVDRLGFWLLVPYLGWVAFATALNVAIAI